MITEEIVVKSPFNLQFRPGANTVLWLPGQDDPQSSRIRDRSGSTTAIDVGSAATDRAALSYAANTTYIDLANSANHDGAIDTVKVWAFNNLTGFRVGTFYLVSGTTYACRASATIGAVTAGAERTFTGLSIEVRTGDYLGCFYATGDIEADTAGGSGVRSYSGEAIDAGDSQTYGLEANNAISLYATGSGANYGTISGATWTRLPSRLWALSFDGTDDYVNCGNNASLQITNNLSIIVWFKTPATFTTGGGSALATVENIISKYTSTGNQRGWHISMVNLLASELVDNIHVTLGDPADGTLEYDGTYTTNLVVSTWYRVTLTFASGALLLQVNGAAATLTTDAGAVPATLWNSTASVFLGAINAGAASLCKGQQALQRMMNTVITPAQDTAGFNQERHLFGV